MRAVVTGGAGFIGSHLIEALLARGDDVLCVERPGASRRWIGHLDVTFAETGLADAAGLAAAVRGADVVFHLAGLTQARTREDYFAVNADGTAAVLRAAAERKGEPPRVIVMSSLAVLGPNRNGELLTTDTVPRPISSYAHSKLLAEAAVHAYADRVPATILRPSTVYGARELGVLTFFRLVRRGVALTIGDWDREVQLLHVMDLVTALLHAAERPQTAVRTYCIAHPETVTWRAFAEAVGRALHRVPRLISVPIPAARLIARGAEICAALRHRAAILNRERVREMTQRRWVCDPMRTFEELGFAPVAPLTVGVPMTAAWYEEAGWL